MHVAALYLVIRMQLYAEHRCSITPSIDAALNIRTIKAVLHLITQMQHYRAETQHYT